MPHSGERLAVDHTLEYSRPLRGLKLWLAFSVHGADAIRHAIERNIEEAQLLASLLEADDAFELLARPQLSAVCFRHLPPLGVDADAHNAALAGALATDGRILLASAEVDGATCLRACIVNHRTTADDVRAIPVVLADVAAKLAVAAL
jgi:aromatic-L-amino-acid/L-tryptophan decarboxylase